MYNKDCTLCPLHLTEGTTCAPAKGPNTGDPKILFVTGDVRPEGGPWKLLLKACKAYGIEDWAIATVVKCRIPPEQKAPLIKQVRACSDYLDAEIEAMSPDWVIPLGNVALQRLTGKTGITKFAGREYDLPEGYHTPPDKPFRIFPMIDPAAVLHDTRQLSTLEQGFAAFRNVLDGKTRSLQYPEYSTIQAVAAMAALRESGATYSLDYETTGLNPRFHKIRTLAIATGEGEAWWTVFSDALVAPLYRLFTEGGTMTAQNAVFEVKWSLWHIIRQVVGEKWRKVRWKCRDSMLFHHLLNENENHRLSYLAKEYTTIGGYDDAMEAAKAADKEAYKTVDLQTLGNYNAGDADACFRLADRFWDELEEKSSSHRGPSLHDLYWQFTEPAIWTVAHCELHGWKFDRAAAGALHAELLAEEVDAMKRMLNHPTVQEFQEHRQALADHDAMLRKKKALALREEKDPEKKREIREEIQAFDKSKNKPLLPWGDYPAGTFNPNSANQVRELLFQRLGIPVIGTTDSDLPATGEKFLRPVEQDHPFITVFLKWKKANTLRQRYLEKRLLPYVFEDGYGYPGFMIHGTVSGRWASSDFNAQNMAPRLKVCFTTRFPGGSFLEADFGQLELRLMAWACDCKSLLKAFAEGGDPHAVTAEEILGRPPRDKEERKKKGKEPNFGFSYGAFPGRFSMEFGVPLKESEKLFKAFHKSKPEIRPWLDRAQSHVGLHGWIKGYLGRIRTVENHNHPDFKKKMHALLSGSNFPIQNLGAELTSWPYSHAVAEVAQLGLQSVPLGAVHDSLLFDCHPDEVEQVAAICRKWMTVELHKEFPWLTVPMVADVEAGPNWGELSEIEGTITAARAV